MTNEVRYRILLVIPNSKWFGKRPWVAMPHSAQILTALLVKKYEFDILDANGKNLSQEETEQGIIDFQPEMVLVTAISVEYFQQYHEVIRLARSAIPACITVMGGCYPTVMGIEVLADRMVDYIFIGHAEERVVDFVDAVRSNDLISLASMPGIGFYRDDAGSAQINHVTSYIGDLKTMVQPDYSRIDMNLYLDQKTKHYQTNSELPTATIMTSYGCPYNCIFCATRTISGRKIAFRAVDDVLEEIDYLVRNHGVGNLIFLDDCLLADRKRAIKLFEYFIRQKYNITFKINTVSAWHLSDDLLELLKQAGCQQITISVESGSQRILNEVIHKPLDLKIIPGIVAKCRALDIDLGANFVIGFPGETWEEIRETFRFAEACDFDLVHFHIATPLPETDLYKVARDQNLLPADFSFRDPKYFGFAQAFISTDEFTAQELMVLRAYEYDRINFKSPEKTAKIAGMMSLTLEELKEHRKQTRLHCGVYY